MKRRKISPISRKAPISKSRKHRRGGSSTSEAESSDSGGSESESSYSSSSDSSSRVNTPKKRGRADRLATKRKTSPSPWICFHITTVLLVNASNVMHIKFFDWRESCSNETEDGKWMYTGGEDCKVRIWDMSSANPQCKRMFDCMTPINAVCLHPNQVEMAIGSQGGGVYLWDVKSDLHIQLIPEVDASVQDIAISPNGAYMAAVNNKGNCYVWSLKSTTEQKLSVLEPKLKIPAHKRYALRCKFSPDSSLLVTTSGDGTARLWKTTDFALWRELKVDNKWVWDAAFSADSKYLFTASSDTIARLWKLDTREIEREYIGHQKAITALSFKDEIVS